MNYHNCMVTDLTGKVQPILAAGSNSVKVTDCGIGDTVALLFGVYRVEMKDGRKQFVKQRDLSEVERRAIGQSLKVQKAVRDDMRW